MDLTKTQLKEVLDLIYTEANTPDIYNGINAKGSLSLYWNEVEGSATIFYNTDGSTKNVVAVFSPENLVYSDGIYTAKVLKDILFSGTSIESRSRGLGAYINLKTFIRNMGVFLGVKLAENFDELNPSIYRDLVDICKKYFDEALDNNAPYFWATYDNLKYQSFVPLMCLVETAIYLRNLGIFRVTHGELCINQFSYYFGTTSVILPESELYTIGDIYQIESRTKFLRIIQIVSEDQTWSLYHNYIPQLINKYGNEIDFTKLLIYSFNNTTLYEIPLSCSISMGSVYNDMQLGCTIYGVYGRHSYIIKEYSYDGTDFSKVVNQYNDQYYYYINESKCILNTKNDKIISNYDSEYTMYNYSTSYIYEGRNISYEGELSSNHVYRVNNDIHTIDKEFALIANNISSHVYNYLRSTNFTIGNNDLCFIFDQHFIVIRNVSTISFNNAYAIKNKNYYIINGRRVSSRSSGQITEVNDYSSISRYAYHANRSIIPQLSIILDDLKNYEVYRFIDSGDYIWRLEESGTFDSLTINFHDKFGVNSYPSQTNIGLLLDYVEPTQLQGLELIQNATYPTSVYDVTTFINTYNQATYRGIYNPWFSDDEIQDSIKQDTWVSCTVLDEPPVDQNDAWDPELDELSDDEINDINKNIDNATQNDDSKPKPTPDQNQDKNKPPNDNKDNRSHDDGGNSSIPSSINDVMNYGGSDFITQYLLSVENMIEFGKAINSKTMALSLKTMLADPLDAIISCQVAPTSLIPTANSSGEHIILRGSLVHYYTGVEPNRVEVIPNALKLINNVKYFNLGSIDIDELFGDYQDLENTVMTLYLPFVGNIDLDIREFYGGNIEIRGFCESYTGQIVYYVIANRSSVSRVIGHFTGNAYANIPLKSDSFGALMNSVTRG